MSGNGLVATQVGLQTASFSKTQQSNCQGTFAPRLHSDVYSLYYCVLVGHYQTPTTTILVILTILLPPFTEFNLSRIVVGSQ